MEWVISGKSMCRAVAVAVEGSQNALGHRIDLTLDFSTHAWPEWETKRGIVIDLFGTDVTLVAGPTSADLGQWRPHARSELQFMSHESHRKVTFSETLTASQLASIEDQRAGRAFRLKLRLYGRAHYVDRVDFKLHPYEVDLPVDRDEWSNALAQSGFSDILILELPVPTADHETRNAVALLRKAIDAKSSGRDADAVGDCRLALNALTNAGFGGAAPSDVIQFIKQNASRLNLAERFSALQAAAELYCSPSHHFPGPNRDEYGRADATFAIAVTAALVQIAGARGRPAERAPAIKSGDK